MINKAIELLALTILSLSNSGGAGATQTTAPIIYRQSKPIIIKVDPVPVVPPPAVVDPNGCEAQGMHYRADSNECIPTSVTASIAPSSNDYDWGNCTWYVANMRAVPAGLGNANAWLGNAQALGMATGSSPRVGAVAWTGADPLGHVAYVAAVYSDGTVLISEMNAEGLGIVDQRTTPASDWFYIY